MLFILLVGSLSCLADITATPYTFYMHTTRTPNATQATWQQCEDRHDILACYCRDTEEVIDGFQSSIAKAIEIITDIRHITANNPDISVDFKGELKPFIKPRQGLIIALTFMPDEHISAENLATLNALAQDLSEAANDQTKVLTQLDKLIKIFNINSGKAQLRVLHLDYKS